MLIGLVLAPVAERPDGLRLPFVVSHDQAALAVGSQILPRIEAEAAEITQASYPPTVVLSTVGLCGVLDDGEVVLSGEGQQRV